MHINVYKRNQIYIPHFPFWLSVAPLIKPITLKCLGHGICDKGIVTRKLRPVHDLYIARQLTFPNVCYLKDM